MSDLNQFCHPVPVVSEFERRGPDHRLYERGSYTFHLFNYDQPGDGTIRVDHRINLQVTHKQGGMGRPEQIIATLPDDSTHEDLFTHGHFRPTASGLYTFATGNEALIVVEVLPA